MPKTDAAIHFIKDYIAANLGLCPSRNEVAKGANVSASTAAYAYQQLERDGLVKLVKPEYGHNRYVLDKEHATLALGERWKDV